MDGDEKYDTTVKLTREEAVLILMALNNYVEKISRNSDLYAEELHICKSLIAGL